MKNIFKKKGGAFLKGISDLKEVSGIYIVTNDLNKNNYIGQSTNIKKRFYSHHLSDYKNKNSSCYNTKFYKALRKYGINNFSVIILEECEKQMLNEREKYYIKKYDSYKHGYNSTEGGQTLSSELFSSKTNEKREVTRKKNKSLMAENHPRARLANDAVLEIRKQYINGVDIKVLYEDYKHIYPNIDTFKRIIFGKSYKSVGNIPEKKYIRYSNSKLTTSEVLEIRERYHKGKITYAALAEEYNVSSTAIKNIIKRISYKHIN